MILAPGQKLRFLGRHATDHCNEAEIELLGHCTRKGNTLEIVKKIKLKRSDRNGSTPFEIIEPDNKSEEISRE